MREKRNLIYLNCESFCILFYADVNCLQVYIMNVNIFGLFPITKVNIISFKVHVEVYFDHFVKLVKKNNTSNEIGDIFIV